MSKQRESVTPLEYSRLRARHILIRRNYSNDLEHDIAAEILNALARAIQQTCDVLGVNSAEQANPIVRAMKIERQLADAMLGPGLFPVWIRERQCGVEENVDPQPSDVATMSATEGKE